MEDMHTLIVFPLIFVKFVDVEKYLDLVQLFHFSGFTMVFIFMPIICFHMSLSFITYGYSGSQGLILLLLYGQIFSLRAVASISSWCNELERGDFSDTFSFLWTFSWKAVQSSIYHTEASSFFCGLFLFMQ